jgi:hypothetical protein
MTSPVSGSVTNFLALIFLVVDYALFLHQDLPSRSYLIAAVRRGA